MLRSGEVYNRNPKKVLRQFRKTEKLKNSRSVRNIIERGYYFIKRKIDKGDK